MAFAYVAIQLFSDEKFEHCIVVPFPEGGKIVDTVVVNNAAFLIVETSPNAKVIQAHFHVVPLNAPLFADGHEYVGHFKFENFMDMPIAVYHVIRITSGDFGVHSFEYQKIYNNVADKIETPETKPEQSESSVSDDFDDSSLRRLWDFDINGGDDKTDNNENQEMDSES